jgi:acetyl-CoA synthetase
MQLNPDAAAAREAFLAAREVLWKHRTDLDAAVQAFRWPRFDQFNWALDYFDVMAEGNDKPGLWIVNDDGSEQTRSFRELAQRSAQVANFLRACGVRRGDRILVMLGNEVALWECMLGAFKLGAVVVPTTALLSTEALRDRIVRGHVRHVIAAAAQVDKFASFDDLTARICVGAAAAGWRAFSESAGAPATFTPDGPTAATDPLLLYFTSGTTSLPKMVLHTHQSYPVGSLSTMYWLGLRQGDVHLNVSSPGWAKHAWSCFFAPWDAGACVFIHNAARFSAVGLLETLTRCHVTSLCAPPTVWRMLIQEDLAAYRGRMSLREVIGAGEPLNPEIIERVREAWGLTLRDGYGQTETTAQIGNSPGQVLKPGSMGRPLPGYEVVLLDASDLPAEEGEICLKLDPCPLGLMTGYEDSPSKTADVMRDGYYHTGDVATRDSGGYLTFVGRADDVFKASDYRISPFELESALLEHEAVTEVAVVPSPDPLRLAVPKAFVTLAKGHEGNAALAQDILAFGRKRLSPFQRVRRIEFVAELPKTVSGKIRRVDLRKLETDRRAKGVRDPGEHFEEDFPALKAS